MFDGGEWICSVEVLSTQYVLMMYLACLEKNRTDIYIYRVLLKASRLQILSGILQETLCGRVPSLQSCLSVVQHQHAGVT